MNKIQLANKVRDITRSMLSDKGQLETSNPSSLQYADILAKFPKLSETLITLMSDDFTMFVQNIEWIAPRPTTFKIILKNSNYYHLIWGGDEFNARVSGTNYTLSSVSDRQRAIKAIQECLILGPIDPSKGAVDLNQDINEPPDSNSEA